MGRMPNSKKTANTLLVSLFIPTVGLLAMVASATATEGTNQNEDELFNLSLEELMRIEVYTASRNPTTITEAPAVLTVITAEQIRKQGLKSLSEVLERVPGFYLDHRQSVQPFIIHRGIKQDQNVGVLLLIDGYPQNMNYAYGLDAEHIFPHLSHVKRIEIVRGSSSTLWGSDASTAVINIITYEGSDLDDGMSQLGSLRASYDHQFRDNRHSTNLTWAKQCEKAQAMLSHSYTQSNAELIGFPAWSGLPLTKYSAWDTIRPSHDVYFNGQYNNLSLHARYAFLATPDGQHVSTSTFNSEISDGGIEKRSKTLMSVNVGHELEISQTCGLESSVQVMDQSLDRFRNGLVTINEMAERKYAVETILRQQAGDWDHKVGLHWSQVTFRSDSSLADLDLPGTENINAGFAETEYSGIDDLRLTLGARIEESDLRSKGTDVMPRFSAVRTLSPQWTAKYAYSTGVVRPQRVYNLLGDTPLLWNTDTTALERTYVTGTNIPQRMYTHEIQIRRNTDSLSMAAAAFLVDAKDLFTWFGQRYDTQAGPGGYTDFYEVWYGNVDHLRSHGVELEFDYRPSEQCRLYGNATYQRAEYRSPKSKGLDGTLERTSYSVGERPNSTPETVWNLGTECDLAEKLTINIHYRGYYGVRFFSFVETERHYVDLNMLYREAFCKGLDLAVYAKNVFDNIDHRDQYGFTELGREIGVRARLQF